MRWIRYAIRNLWRNRRRSATIIMITTVGTAALLTFGGYMLYTFESLAEMSARRMGHVILSDPRFFVDDEPEPMAYGIDEWQEVRRAMEDDPRVRHALPRLEFTGLISNGEKSTIFTGTGVDPAQELLVYGPFLNIRDGGGFAVGPDGPPEVMLGVDLARSLGASAGSTLTVLSTTSHGSLNGIDVVVAGTFGTGVPELDKRALMMPLTVAQELLLTTRVSTLSAYLADIGQTDAFAVDQRTLHPSLAATPWVSRAVFYLQVKSLYSWIFGLVGLVIVCVVLLAVLNTVTITVMERTREIGTMAAMGAFPGQIVTNFIIESSVIGAAGALFGMSTAGLLTGALYFADVTMPPPPGSNIGYPLALTFSWAMYGGVAALVVAVTMAGGYMASRSGVRKSIVEALIHV